MGFEKKQCESNSDQQSIRNLTRVILSVRLCCIIIVVTVTVVVCVVAVVAVVVVVVVVVVELNDMEHIKIGSKPPVFDTFDFQMCFAPQRRALFRHRLAIKSSKSGPNPRCFDTFDFKMCFAPHRRALFPHLNFQKSSEPEVFCTF